MVFLCLNNSWGSRVISSTNLNRGDLPWPHKWLKDPTPHSTGSYLIPKASFGKLQLSSTNPPLKFMVTTQLFLPQLHSSRVKGRRTYSSHQSPGQQTQEDWTCEHCNWTLPLWKVKFTLCTFSIPSLWAEVAGASNLFLTQQTVPKSTSGASGSAQQPLFVLGALLAAHITMNSFY